MGDFFRNRPGRYLGYAHIVASVPGDILTPVARFWMTRATMGYMAFDVIHKASDGRSSNLVSKGLDAAIWQLLASSVVPSLLVRGTNHVSPMLVGGLKIQTPVSRHVPLGLAVVSLILLGHQMDKAVDKVLDNTTRPLLL
ncbi:mitochondrial fission process protein 1-like [Macrosteles quadrilineatus]|uniref:mitochondrial fission process protein 1-like n=1 Tax=Macrosteles quadrilineatus TaxID=74068 RepID=UPI0023E32175|nr:mitochondrial fission process protein 1-like [Macrosteles quadrilineatus]